MSILNGELIKVLKLIDPIEERVEREYAIRGFKKVKLSSGIGPAGYDVSIDYLENGLEKQTLKPSEFTLVSVRGEFNMPNNLVGLVKDKSTLARLGISVFNTVIEPGWKGFLTVEVVNLSSDRFTLYKDMPIAQVIFQETISKTSGYDGKYQNQKRGINFAK